MKNKTIFFRLVMCFALIVAMTSCDRDDQLVGDPKVISTDMPLDLEWVAGNYSFNFTPGQCRGNADYRVQIDKQLLSEGALADNGIIPIDLDANLSTQKRHITIEFNHNGEWELVAQRWQKAGLVKMGKNYWTQGNLTVENEKYTLAKPVTNAGLLFKFNSLFGVSNQEASYSGFAYGPAKTEIALDDIEFDIEDPCSAATNGQLRLPTLSELNAILETAEATTIGSTPGISIGGGSLFLPLTGTLDDDGNTTTEISGYWTSSKDADGKVFALFALGEFFVPMATSPVLLLNVRCVRNVAVPTYVSHNPINPKNNKQSIVEVTTDAGDADSYTVSLVQKVEGEDEEAKTYSAIASAKSPVVEISIPENKSFSEQVYFIYVDGNYAGVEITQPGITDFAEYISHTPTNEEITDKEFTLNVKIKTDLDKAPIKVTGPGFEEIKYASKATPEASFTIPENRSTQEREFTITVLDEEVEAKVIQPRTSMKLFSVVWSDGYLTVKDGKYVFTEYGETPLLYRYMSTYAMAIARLDYSVDYAGYCYKPEKVDVALADIPFNGDVDPCSLVEPLNTWRMPTSEDKEDLLSFTSSSEENKHIMFADDLQEVYLYNTGIIAESGMYFKEDSFKIWTSSVSSTGRQLVIEGDYSRVSSYSTAKSEQGLAVRCVKERD